MIAQRKVNVSQTNPTGRNNQETQDVLLRRKASLRRLLGNSGVFSRKAVSLETLRRLYDDELVGTLELARMVSPNMVTGVYEKLGEMSELGLVDPEVNNALVETYLEYYSNGGRINLLELSDRTARAFRTGDAVFCESNRPASAGIIEYAMIQRGIMGEFYLVVSNNQEWPDHRAGATYNLGNTRTEQHTASVNIVNILARLSRMLEIWLMPKETVGKMMSRGDLTLGYTRTRMDTIRKAIEIQRKEGRRWNPGEMPIENCIRIVTQREILTVFRELMKAGNADEIANQAAVQRMLCLSANIFLRGTIMHESTHLLTAQQCKKNGYDIKKISGVVLELIAYCAQAVYSNPAVAFVGLLEYIQNLDNTVRGYVRSGLPLTHEIQVLASAMKTTGYLNLRNILTEGIVHEIEELDAMIFLQEGRFLRRIAKQILEETCRVAFGQGHEEFFRVTIPHKHEGYIRINPLRELRRRLHRTIIIGTPRLGMKERTQLIVELMSLPISHEEMTAMIDQEVQAAISAK